MTIWQGEHFLCGHIRREHDSVLCERLRTDPFVSAWQAEGEVCTRGLIMQSRIVFRLHITGALLQILDMLLPGRNRIWLCCARGFKNGLPKFFLRLFGF